MRPNTFILLTLSTVVSLALAADPPTISQSDLNALAGNWSGTLMYLDYGDDSTWVTLDARMTAAATKEGLMTSTTTTDSSGAELLSEEKYFATADGKRIRMKERTWMVSGKNVTDNGTTFAFQGPGQDDNRSAQIINLLFISTPDTSRQDSLVISKQVLYDSAPKEILRSKLRLGRISE